MAMHERESVSPSSRVKIPYGKYQYELEGLAAGQRCHIARAVAEKESPEGSRPRLFFQVALPKGCFVLSVLIKLPTASEEQLSVLDDIIVERAAFGSKYEAICRKQIEKKGKVLQVPLEKENNIEVEEVKLDIDAAGKEQDKEKVEIVKASAKQKGSAVVEVQRVADSLRIGMIDVEEDEAVLNQILKINVIGFVRGQSPGGNRIKTLFNAASEVTSPGSTGDRIELDILCGLASLASRKYHQAAELLHRAVVTMTDDKNRAFLKITTANLARAAEIELLVAFASFEHTPMCPHGITALQNVASLGSKPRVSSSPLVSNFQDEFYDVRTELLTMLNRLAPVLVKFLGDSVSMAVRMAAGRMLEFIIEQLGCAVAPHLTSILELVLKTYQDCRPLGAREKAAAASFPYDEMQECYERLIDSSCRLLPLTEHSLVKKVYDETLVPLIVTHYKSSEYLSLYEHDELLCTAVAQTLRISYLVLNILKGDADTPAPFLARILDMIIVEDGLSQTPITLRRAAFHTWDAILLSLSLRAKGRNVDEFRGCFSLQQEYIKKLIHNTKREPFQYNKSVEFDGFVQKIIVCKENELLPEDSIIMQEILRRRETRSEVSDKRALQRVMALIQHLCVSLNACASNNSSNNAAPVLDLQETLAVAAADLLMSTVVDIAYYESATSGNGDVPSNAPFFDQDNFESQLETVGELLRDILNCYWTSLRLLPRELAEQAENSSPVKRVLLFLLYRCRQQAPPAGVWYLLRVAVVSLNNELNKSMHDKAAELSFLSLLRSALPWLAQASSEHPFDFFDAILPVTISSMDAADLLSLFTSLADQTEELQERGSVSLGHLATLIASSVPEDPEAAVETLKELVKPDFPHQRIVDSFPRKARRLKSGGSSSFTRRLFSSEVEHECDPYVKSFYLHIVLVSCFDKLDWITFQMPKKGGAIVFGEHLDDFVEHAAFLVRVLHACSRAGSHRPYVGELLSSILGKALEMQDHMDGRVRLVGFEIFAASLDMLFLARKASVVLAKRREETSLHTDNAITELPQSDLKDVADNATEDAMEMSPTGINDPNSVSDAGAATKVDNNIVEGIEKGGCRTFTSESLPAAKLHHEKRAWDNLCVFLKSSLGVGKYVDFVVQRAVLEYLKGSLLNSITHRSSGASQIRFEHIRDMWSSVERLNGSPWRTLNALSFYILLIISNVALYSILMVKGRAQGRARQAQFDFIRKSLFPAIERGLRHTTKEGRLHASQLLQCYLEARTNNRALLEATPDLTKKIIELLKSIENDWDADLRSLSQDLLGLRLDGLKKKESQTGSFTQSMRLVKEKITYTEDGVLGNERFVLWFPPAPGLLAKNSAEGFTRTLDAFVSLDIAGGEETEEEQDGYLDEEEYSDDPDLSEPEAENAAVLEGESQKGSDDSAHSGENVATSDSSEESLMEVESYQEDAKRRPVAEDEIYNKVVRIRKDNDSSDAGDSGSDDGTSTEAAAKKKGESPKAGGEIELERMPQSNLLRAGSFSRLPSLDSVSFGSGERPRLSRRRSIDTQALDDMALDIDAVPVTEEEGIHSANHTLDSDDQSQRSQSPTTANDFGALKFGGSKSLSGTSKNESSSKPKNRLPRGPAFVKKSSTSVKRLSSKANSVDKERSEVDPKKRTRLPRGQSSKMKSVGSVSLKDMGAGSRKKKGESVRLNKSSIDLSSNLAEDDFGGTMVQEEDLSMEPVDYDEVEFEKFPVSKGSRGGSTGSDKSSGQRRYSRRVTSSNMLGRIENYNSLIDRISGTDEQECDASNNKNRKGPPLQKASSKSSKSSKKGQESTPN